MMAAGWTTMNILLPVVWPSKMSKLVEFMKMIKSTVFFVSETRFLDVKVTRSQSAVTNFRLRSCQECSRRWAASRLLTAVTAINLDLVHTSSYDLRDIILWPARHCKCIYVYTAHITLHLRTKAVFLAALKLPGAPPGLKNPENGRVQLLSMRKMQLALLHCVPVMCCLFII